jgi:hypothetical protein
MKSFQNRQYAKKSDGLNFLAPLFSRYSLSPKRAGQNASWVDYLKRRNKGSPPKYTVRISLDLLNQQLPVVCGFESLYSSTFDGTANDMVQDTRGVDAGFTRHS